MTRMHFLECAGNGRKAFREPKGELTPQYIDGQFNNVEWTGVPLGRVLAEAGVKPEGNWLLSEGGDASVLSRSVPMKKALEDCLLVYASNGEALRPAHGYPVRLLVPGWEANMSIKWLRRLEVTDQPSMSKDETAKYTDPLPGDRARQFSFGQDAKSIILSPSHPMTLTPGFWPITGLAWSGRGRIQRVDVSTDGGTTWSEAELQGPNTGRCAVRFVHPWTWEGAATQLMSRAIDETGYVHSPRTASSSPCVARARITTSIPSAPGPSARTAAWPSWPTRRPHEGAPAAPRRRPLGLRGRALPAERACFGHAVVGLAGDKHATPAGGSGGHGPRAPRSGEARHR